MGEIKLAEAYGQELKNAYPQISHFADIYGRPIDKKLFVGAKGVYVPSMNVTGARFVDRDDIDGNFHRNFSTNHVLKEMRMDRDWDTLVDPMDIDESNKVASIANITKTFNEKQKVPEMDAYAASSIAAIADALGGNISTSITSASALTVWDSMLEYLAEKGATSGLVAKVRPSVYTALKNAAGLSRFIEVSPNAMNIDRRIASLDGVRVQTVPSDLMKSEYDFTLGFVPDASADDIGILMYDPASILAPVKYETVQLDEPSAKSKGKFLYYERYYYDVFGYENMGGFAVAKTAPSLGTLTVTSVAGTKADGDTVITYSGACLNANGDPFDGFDVYITSGQAAAVSCTYGSPLDSDETWTKISGKDPVTLESQTASKYATVAVVNKATGGCIASGNAVLVVKS